VRSLGEGILGTKGAIESYPASGTKDRYCRADAGAMVTSARSAAEDG
jgi:hypothetical protein